ncbi:MAG: hypothetical protein OJF51_005108 [Nitrospira sp.]|nr:MAG: hypothetical protein OJF51_005108 [Nitrospira sp.]
MVSLIVRVHRLPKKCMCMKKRGKITSCHDKEDFLLTCMF